MLHERANRILDLHREWNEAYPRLDCAALDRIIADDWVCIDATGLVITKSELLTRVASSASFLDRYKFDEIALRIFGEAAILTGRLSGQMQDSDGTHEIDQRYMRVYVKRNERWHAVATQVTKVKDLSSGEQRPRAGLEPTVQCTLYLKVRCSLTA